MKPFAPAVAETPGCGVTVIGNAADGADEHPLLLATTVYEPCTLALYVWEVAPMIALPFKYH